MIHNYGVLNQIEPWTVVSRPHEDWALMLWCGENPAMTYAGGIVITKATYAYGVLPDKEVRTEDKMPAYVRAEFGRVLAKHKMTLEKNWFPNDASACAGDYDDDSVNAPKSPDSTQVEADLIVA